MRNESVDSQLAIPMTSGGNRIFTAGQKYGTAGYFTVTGALVKQLKCWFESKLT